MAVVAHLLRATQKRLDVRDALWCGTIANGVEIFVLGTSLFTRDRVIMKTNLLNSKDQFAGFDLYSRLVEAFDNRFEQFEQFFQGVGTRCHIISKSGESVSPFLRKISIKGAGLVPMVRRSQAKVPS
jgi:hypothetical protein